MKRLLCLAALAAPLFGFAPAESKPKSIVDLALEKAFPKCEIQRVLCRLDEPQRERVGKLATQSAYGKSTTFAYIARRKDQVVGTGFFDSHPVRTKRETLLVCVDPTGTVKRVDTVAFNEPREYIAQDAFYASLLGRAQGRPLQLGRGLDGTTGATLTCRAVADACRRVLALHEVLGEKVGRIEEVRTAQAHPDRPRETR